MFHDFLFELFQIRDNMMTSCGFLSVKIIGNDSEFLWGEVIKFPMVADMDYLLRSDLQLFTNHLIEICYFFDRMKI